jgi:hypothetical protein
MYLKLRGQTDTNNSKRPVPRALGSTAIDPNR